MRGFNIFLITGLLALNGCTFRPSPVEGTQYIVRLEPTISCGSMTGTDIESSLFKYNLPENKEIYMKGMTVFHTETDTESPELAGAWLKISPTAFGAYIFTKDANGLWEYAQEVDSREKSFVQLEVTIEGKPLTLELSTDSDQFLTLKYLTSGCFQSLES